MIRAIIFGVASLLLGFVSRSSLAHPRSHGFFRFWAWECILALIVINSRRWFQDPLAPHQLVSWFLLVASLVPLQQGVRLLQSRGRPDSSRVDEVPLLGIEKTTQLVTTGAFRYIRHPLYCSLLLLAWGAFFKHPSGSGAGLALAATVFLFVTARVEEAENLRYFGPRYGEYMQETKMFLPFLI